MAEFTYFFFYDLSLKPFSFDQCFVYYSLLIKLFAITNEMMSYSNCKKLKNKYSQMSKFYGGGELG